MKSISTLTEVVDRFHSLPALRAKGSLGLVARTFGATDWVHGPGDDSAVVESEGDSILFAGEAIWPPFVESDPYGAGVAAVVANVNDVAAMGGRPLALVDHVVAGREGAERVLQGIAFAAGLYRLPVVGGHLTVWDGAPSVSASILGRAQRPLSALNVAAGQEVLAAFCLDGTMRSDFPYFSSIHRRAGRLAGDVEILAELAEEGLIGAAKDVSMPGILGTLAMLLEPTGCGASVDLEALPRPEGVSLADWCFVFPTFGFVFCVSPPDRNEVCGRFQAAGLACEPVGSIDATGRLRARFHGEEAELMDLNSSSVTGLSRET